MAPPVSWATSIPPSLNHARAARRFLRNPDSASAWRVFHRTIGLRDSWAKAQGR
jgi:hypothetical protein